MQLGPSLANRLLTRPRSYYRRKAGKDLFDLAVLLGEDAGEVFVSLLEEHELLSEATQVPETLDPGTVELARDFAEREGTHDPLEAVEGWLDV